MTGGKCDNILTLSDSGFVRLWISWPGLDMALMASLFYPLIAQEIRDR